MIETKFRIVVTASMFHLTDSETDDGYEFSDVGPSLYFPTRAKALKALENETKWNFLDALRQRRKITQIKSPSSVEIQRCEWAIRHTKVFNKYGLYTYEDFEQQKRIAAKELIEAGINSYVEELLDSGKEVQEHLHGYADKRKMQHIDFYLKLHQYLDKQIADHRQTT